MPAGDVLKIKEVPIGSVYKLFGLIYFRQNESLHVQVEVLPEGRLRVIGDGISESISNLDEDVLLITTEKT